MKYEDWLYEWLNDYLKSSIKRRTYEGYGAIVRLHILPRLGGYAPNEITPLVLQKFISELTESGNRRTGKGLSPNFVKSIISVVQNSLKTAYVIINNINP